MVTPPLVVTVIVAGVPETMVCAADVSPLIDATKYGCPVWVAKPICLIGVDRPPAAV